MVPRIFAGAYEVQTAVRADGENPATHSIVKLYQCLADYEVLNKLSRKDPAREELLNTIVPISTQVSTGMLGVVKSWGDFNDTDAVSDVHYLTVTDPAVFASMAEMEAYGYALATDADYARSLVAVQTASTHLGASIVQDVKAWGPATLKTATR